MPNPLRQPSEIAEGYVAIGRISKPWGIRGEVKMTLHTDFPERFQDLAIVYVGPAAQPVELLHSRPHSGQMLLLLAGYESRPAAEALRGLWVQIPEQDVMPLAEDEHYIFELVGLQVHTTDGRHLGEIENVLFTGANEVFVVRGNAGQILIPYIDDVIAAEDFEAGRIVVEPIPGLLG